MRNVCGIVRLLLPVVAAALLAPTAHAELVYNNSSNDLTNRFNPGTNEVGDEIVLAGGGRILTDFTFQYWGVFTNSGADARIRFYANDGSTNGLPLGSQMPSTVLFDSGWFGIIPTNRATYMFNDFTLGGGNLIALTGPVPTDFTWSVQFSGLTAGESAGVDLYSPPTVGTNYADYWDNTVSGWELRASTNGVPINFAARINATPEPGTLWLGLLGGLVFWGLKVRNSRR
jgi:hypothetical protein